MKPLLLFLLLLSAPPLIAQQGPSRPLWNSETEIWLRPDRYTRAMRDDRPLWKKVLSSAALWADTQEIHRLPASAGLSQRVHNYNVAIGLKFTIFF